MDFHAYLLHCSNGKYYAGHTDNLEVRIAQHQRGEFGGWTSKHRPVQLVWSEAFPERDQAFAVLSGYSG